VARQPIRPQPAPVKVSSGAGLDASAIQRALDQLHSRLATAESIINAGGVSGTQGSQGSQGSQGLPGTSGWTGYTFDALSYGLQPNLPSASGSNRIILQNLVVTGALNGGADILLPSGNVYIGQDRLLQNWSLKLTGLSGSNIRIRGCGIGVTNIVMTGSGDGGEWDGIVIDNGARRVSLQDFSIRFDWIPHPDTIDQNHLVEINNTSAGGGVVGLGTGDVHIQDVEFGPTPGACVRLIGEASGVIDNVYLDRVQFRSSASWLNGSGSRSCLEANRGVYGLFVSNFWMEGAKNSCIDIEKTVVAPNTYMIIRDGVVKNTGRTFIPVAIAGLAASPTDRNALRNVRIIDGQLNLLGNDQLDVVDVEIHCGVNGTTTGSAPLLYVFQNCTNSRFHNVTITREAVVGDGDMVYVLGGNGAFPSNLSFKNVRLNQYCNGNGFQVESCNGITVDGVDLIYTGVSASTYYAAKFRSVGQDMLSTRVNDVHVSTSAGLQMNAGVYFSTYTAGYRIGKNMVTNCRMSGTVGIGVIYEQTSPTGAISQFPILQGNDFSGATNPWIATLSATGSVFPVVAGNLGLRTYAVLESTVSPVGTVPAPDGTWCIYHHLSGTSRVSDMYFKATGSAGSDAWSTSGWVLK
jgi:hypothetical protein